MTQTPGNGNATVDEREEAGRAARKTCPRRTLGEWQPAADRPDPISIITAQDAARVPELVGIRHSRMTQSPFAFYRGSAALMAQDLGTAPNSGLITQLCGDAHLSNFGLFGAPDRSVVFDLNDFDETHPGPFEWDVARMATSFTLAAESNGFAKAWVRDITLASSFSYRTSMAAYAPLTNLEVWYSRIDASNLTDMARELVGKRGQRAADRSVNQARRRDSWSAIDKVTQVVDGRRQFLDQPPLLVRLSMDGDRWEIISRLFGLYRSTLQDDLAHLLRRYQPIDFAHKVVGVGSVGLRAFVLLMQGRDENDLIVLQVKEAVRSVLEPFTKPSVYSAQGHRVVAGQRQMQAASDVFLGWVTAENGRDFYVRQLRDMKWSPDVTGMKPEMMRAYAVLCGRTLARAHARGGDAIALSAYLGTSDAFDESVLAFAERYAQQVEDDFAAFSSAVKSGVLSVQSDEVDAVRNSLQAGFQRKVDSLGESSS